MPFFQHGDVIIEACERTDAGEPNRGNKHVLAEGEVTGHAHRIESDKVKSYGQGTASFIDVEEICRVTHEEHKPALIPEGFYKKRIVNEFGLLEQRSREVRD